MTFAGGALLFIAGVVGGGLNSVAGGGSFIVFPALLLGGMAPVAANATTTVALWPAGVASAYAYRRELPREKKLLAALSIASAAGGALGAKLLLVTSDTTFAHLLPVLMFLASAVFTFGPRLSKGRRAKMPLVAGAIIQLVIATYGGYFGGGMGILMLATYTLMGMTDMHAMNGLKTLLGSVINGVAVVLFLVSAKASLASAAPIAFGSVAGGFAGAALARRIDSGKIRRLVLVFAWSLTLWFLYRAIS